ncbi:unnamed protein product [Hermetia illucens]|uniref:CHK kinase-like domain-containing protein n=2 Tax=Hermetia illucens TaxID=343691 RepID=A0A7R8V7X6_HERIL|nr:uncharacterized protein LOC119660444 isoform X1 [Hermetia illucens]CAD7093765.1 unnamed protein product [Hermetia illucens]
MEVVIAVVSSLPDSNESSSQSTKNFIRKLKNIRADLVDKMGYSKDELVPPAWIDSDYLKRVLETDLKETIQIKSYTICPAASATDHFTSLIFRTRITYSSDSLDNGDISLIIKTLPTEDGLKKDIAECYDIFAFEGSIFSKVLPVCHKMLRDINCQDILGARIFYQSSEPQKNLVLQDLKQFGYSTPSRNYLSAEECEAMFNKLALLHATTFKMHADGNTDVSKFKGVFLNMPDIEDVFLFANAKDLLAEVMKDIPGLEEYSPKLKALSNKALIDKCIQVINEPGSYNVLNHGDLYAKNMMVKTTENGSDIVFVDYQLCHWGSPAVDVAYIASEIPPRNRTDAIRHYFDVFTRTLQKLGYQGETPTFAQLETDLKRRQSLELYVLIVSAPFMAVDETSTNTEGMDIDTFMADRNFIIQSFKDEQFVALLKDLMPIYLEEGYFDHLL